MTGERSKQRVRRVLIGAAALVLVPTGAALAGVGSTTTEPPATTAVATTVAPTTVAPPTTAAPETTPAPPTTVEDAERPEDAGKPDKPPKADRPEGDDAGKPEGVGEGRPAEVTAFVDAIHAFNDCKQAARKAAPRPLPEGFDAKAQCAHLAPTTTPSGEPWGGATGGDDADDDDDDADEADEVEDEAGEVEDPADD